MVFQFSNKIRGQQYIRIKELVLRYLFKIDNNTDRGIVSNASEIYSFRTGIICDESYSYSYNRNKKENQGRVYFTKPIIINKDYILNICIILKSLIQIGGAFRFQQITLGCQEV